MTTTWLPRLAVGIAVLAFVLGRVDIADADTAFVVVESNDFSPNEVFISTGDTLCWMWTRGSHTTTSVDGLWDSGILPPGSMFEFTFGDAGDFAYICTLHIDCCNMAGIVHVVDPLRLAASLGATEVDPNASGAASFEMRPNRASFSVAVAGVSSTAAVDVFVNGNPVGTIALDASGSGALVLDTQQGDTVPPLQEGDEVEVLDATDDMTLILVGTLASGG